MGDWSGLSAASHWTSKKHFVSSVYHFAWRPPLHLPPSPTTGEKEFNEMLNSLMWVTIDPFSLLFFMIWRVQFNISRLSLLTCKKCVYCYPLGLCSTMYICIYTSSSYLYSACLLPYNESIQSMLWCRQISGVFQLPTCNWHRKKEFTAKSCLSEHPVNYAHNTMFDLPQWKN